MPEGVIEEEVDISTLSPDEQELARMGYKQELNRSWSGFSNFAISFSIISILAGCFTTFYAGWNGGGPAAIAWGWPVLAALVLCIGLCLSELVSAFPTSGGIYWWASKLGGVKAGYYTGWLNLIGLLAIVASVAYGCATFFDLTLGFLAPGSYTSGNLDTIFLYFLAILVIAAVVNIFSSHLLGIFNNVSVWWHVLGATAIVLILIFLPDHHASANMVFTSTVNNTGFFGGKTNGWGFIFIVLPLGALLTQYTITGYDASAHLSEETHSAADSAAKGIWRSIFYSAIGGWILLLSFLFAVQNEAGVTKGGGGVATIFAQALTSKWGGTVLLIATDRTALLHHGLHDELHAHALRLQPGRGRSWQQTLVQAELPACPGVRGDRGGRHRPHCDVAGADQGQRQRRGGARGLQRRRLHRRHRPLLVLRRADLAPLADGRRFEGGSWSLGAKYKWLSVIALLDIVLVSFMAFLPNVNLGVPWVSGFSWKFVNYTILVFPGALILLWIYWHVSVKNWFTGPKTHDRRPSRDPRIVAALSGGLLPLR